MKASNLIRIFALILVVITAAAFTATAKKPVTVKAPSTAATIENTLAKCLKFPANGIKSDYEGTVDVIFVIEDGKLIVEKAESDNKELANYVKKELPNICCKHICTLTNQHYEVNLKFVLEEN